MLSFSPSWLEKLGRAVATCLGEPSPPGFAPKPLPSLVLPQAILSDLLPYESVEEDWSLFLNKRSTGFMLEVSPLLGSSEEIEAILASLQESPSSVRVSKASCQ